MECNGGDDTCFCVSMGTNRTDDYALALNALGRGRAGSGDREAFAPFTS